MSFENLGLHEALVRAVKDAGYESATEIQAQAIPAALKGLDLMGSSRTGSGKTAAFVLPALDKILAARQADAARPRGRNYGPRVLVLAPTRELAQQVAKAAQTYGRHVPGLRICTVLGGMPLVLAHGAGAESRRALGLVMVGGLTMAAIATLLLTPVAYLLLARFSKPRSAEAVRLARELEEAPAQDAADEEREESPLPPEQRPLAAE